MEDQNPYLLFEEDYVHPKQEEKDALILKLQSGDFSLSYSSLSKFAVSPRAFIAYKLQEYKTTNAMIMGEAVHCKILEPEEFKNRYFIAPTVNAATSEGKNTWAKIYMDLTGDELPVNKQGNYVIPKVSELIAAIKLHTSKIDPETKRIIFEGVTVLPGTINEQADFRANMLIHNRATRWVIDQITQTETSIEFEFEGVRFKGRVDGHSANMICDIKNMPDATIRAATYTIKGRKMAWQGFCYNTAMEGERDYFILAVDANGETSCHSIGKKEIENAGVEMREYVQRFKELIEESRFDPTVWDQSQDFWLRTEVNPIGINFI
jgi:hypothetical protein